MDRNILETQLYTRTHLWSLTAPRTPNRLSFSPPQAYKFGLSPIPQSHTSVWHSLFHPTETLLFDITVSIGLASLSCFIFAPYICFPIASASITISSPQEIPVWSVKEMLSSQLEALFQRCPNSFRTDPWLISLLPAPVHSVMVFSH